MRSTAVFLIALVIYSGPSHLGARESARPLKLRREYNQVAARIDTLINQYGSENLDLLEDLKQVNARIPAETDLVLLFWADDEAEVFLNGFLVGQTRLTPTLVKIPELYLREYNVLRAHCWDTDRVESGFMAGLYLRDTDGRMRRVLVSGDPGWKAAEAKAQSIYYNHPQPDIPGAQVIWGEALFGDVHLKIEFPASALREALARSPQPDPTVVETPMATHDLISRLVFLQERRIELAQQLARERVTESSASEYKGFVNSCLAFTLGRARPLQESAAIDISRRLHEWASRLPEVHQQLILEGSRPRPLKGVTAATPSSETLEFSSARNENRRKDYVPPKERAGGGGRSSQAGGGAGFATVLAVRGFRWGIVAFAVAMAGYVGAIGRRWWLLFNGKVWVS